MPGPVLLPGEQPIPLPLRSQASLFSEAEDLTVRLIEVLEELQGREQPAGLPFAVVRLVQLLSGH